MSGTINFAIPKGSLEKATFEILERAWYNIYGKERTYRPVINDEQIKLKMLRPQEIPNYVSQGIYDVGISGLDWVEETNADVEILTNLEYGKVKIVLAIPEDDSIKSCDDLINTYLKRNKILRISTEYLNIASKYIKKNNAYKKKWINQDPKIVTPWKILGNNEKISLFLSFGATEAKPPEEADAIIDLTETGTTLKRNKLKIIDTVYESSTCLMANKKSLQDSKKREKIFDILSLLRGAVESKKNVHIFVNVKKENLDKLLKELPALKNPTISNLSDKNWYSVNTIIKKTDLLKIIPKLRKLSQGLVVHEPKQILPLEKIAQGENNE